MKACRYPALLGLLLCLPLAQAQAQAQVEALTQARTVVEGRVTRVTDGDTLRVQLASGPVTVRLHGIDAPERDQPWGREAGAALRARVLGQSVDLEPRNQDQYDRLVAVVLLGGENVNAWLVREGHAWAYRRFVDDEAFCRLEGEARASGRGLWARSAAAPRPPWNWRRAQRDGGGGDTRVREVTVAACIAEVRGPAPRPPRGPARR